MSGSDETPVLYTYDWLPDFPRGFVRDLRVRWAFEELGRPYRIATFPVGPKSAEHFDLQPFGQVPVLRTQGQTLFESGAILLHLADEGSALMPAGGRDAVTQWLIAALNSVESFSQPWVLMIAAQKSPEIFGPAPDAAQIDRAAKRMRGKLDGVERHLSGQDWLVGGFSAADIVMVDVLRNVAAANGLGGHPALGRYVDRAATRPAFRRAFADHMAHWQEADARRARASA